MIQMCPVALSNLFKKSKSLGNALMEERTSKDEKSNDNSLIKIQLDFKDLKKLQDIMILNESLIAVISKGSILGLIKAQSLMKIIGSKASFFDQDYLEIAQNILSKIAKENLRGVVYEQYFLEGYQQISLQYLILRMQGKIVQFQFLNNIFI